MASQDFRPGEGIDGSGKADHGPRAMSAPAAEESRPGRVVGQPGRLTTTGPLPDPVVRPGVHHNAAASKTDAAALAGDRTAQPKLDARDDGAKALDALRARLRQPDPADIIERRSVEARNDALAEIPPGALSEAAALRFVKQDIASLHRIDDPRERHSAAVAMGHNARDQDRYQAELARRDPYLADLVMLAYAKERQAVSKKEERKQLPTDIPSATKGLVNSIERVSSRQSELRTRDGQVPLEDRFLVVTRLARGRDYEFRDQPGVVAFRERWLTMTSSVDSQAVVKAMLDRAGERGWTEVRIDGSEMFRRQAWIAATARGIRASGHEPSPTDRDAASEESRRLDRAGADASGRRFTAEKSLGPSGVSRETSSRREPATDRPGERVPTLRTSGPEAPAYPVAIDQHPPRRPSADKILAALELAFERKNTPPSLRAEIREQVNGELKARHARGEGIQVPIYDVSASRQNARVPTTPRPSPDRERVR